VETTLDALTERVADYIVRPESGPETPTFEALALDLFEFQFANNPPYRNYCRSLRRTPDTVSRSDQIPAVPTRAFKEFELTCLPAGRRPEAVFLTSGTTLGKDRPGRHLLANLSLYHAAIRRNFEIHLVPDGRRMPMFILTAPPSLWKQSSLAHMMEVVRTEFGAPDSRYYIGDDGLDADRLIKDLEASASRGTPVFLLGITLAFFRLMEEIKSRGRPIPLPPGSRIMDTGGFKGLRPEIGRPDVRRRYREAFGVPEELIVNEYGMTEMSSQFYDNPIADRAAGRTGPRRKTIPRWVKTRILDPVSLEPVPAGAVGILHHLDLANAGSVASVLTEDLGSGVGDGFDLAGRVRGAEARGCALLLEELRRS
jgi:hypothetical protein